MSSSAREPQHSVSSSLTSSQSAAVDHFEGPLLILAGPGSGKTRVITRRIARLIEQGVRPYQILALTFTNKAAREMAERVDHLLPGSRVWVTTFHKFCARLLREYGRAVGLQANFTIFDTQDQRQLLKQVLSDEDVDASFYSPAKVSHLISQAKNDGLGPEEYEQRIRERYGDPLEAVTARVFPHYQRLLLEANAVDFDDLLGHVARMLADQPELREQLDERFRFILVDEYQDTNRPQYQIVAALSQRYPNLCVTGDPDQSIYGWRGAQIENILRFERDYPRVRIIRLEENFRSTAEILRSADALIAHNRQRKAKSLIATGELGDPVELWTFDDSMNEAAGIVADIGERLQAGRARPGDVAILFRVNAQSRALETQLAQARIPFLLASGVGFYERAEVKDLLAYLRLIENPADTAALNRIINVPVRGIGATSWNRLKSAAATAGLTPLEACRRPEEFSKVPRKAAYALRRFSELMDELTRLADRPVQDVLTAVLDRTGYHRNFSGDSPQDQAERRANIDELVAAAGLYDQQSGDEGSVGGFLESASLAQDVDSLDRSQGQVTLLTLHAAKGLEFPVVYVVGLEQNLMPHERAIRDGELSQLEEERRLLFVGMTRAQKSLTLTRARRRWVQGRFLSTIHSQFLDELPYVERNFSADDLEDGPASRVPLGSTGYSFARTSFQHGSVAAGGTRGRALDDWHDEPVIDVRGTAEPDSAADERPATRSPETAAVDVTGQFTKSVVQDAYTADGAQSHASLTATKSRPHARPPRAGRAKPSTDSGTEPAAGSKPAIPPTASDVVPTLLGVRSSRGSNGSEPAVGLSRTDLAELRGKLTTGAALLAGQTQSAEPPRGFRVGMQVRHPQYGVGRVLSLSDDLSSRRSVTVQFDSRAEPQTFVVEKCPLQPLGQP